MRKFTAASLFVIAITFAVAPASAEQNGVSGWLDRFGTALDTLGHSEEALTQFCTNLPHGVSCENWPTGSYPCSLANGERGTCRSFGRTFVFTEPVSARTVARALGVRTARIASGDVHMRQWSLVDMSTRATPVRGLWMVHAYSERPSGPSPSERLGPSPAYRVTSRARVTRISISPDFENPHAGLTPRLWR